MFGDSSIDVGNNNCILTIAGSNLQPHGHGFLGGKAIGIFFNRTIPTDIISEVAYFIVVMFD